MTTGAVARLATAARRPVLVVGFGVTDPAASYGWSGSWTCSFTVGSPACRFGAGYNQAVSFGRARFGGLSASLPSVVFALAFVLLGWVAGHSISYALVGFVSHEHHMHDYLDVLELGGGLGLVLALVLALRAFFRHGSFGEWLHKGGFAGTRRQIALATVLPASAFVAVEYIERLVAGTGEPPSASLLVMGVFVQVVVGLLSLALVRVTFRAAERIVFYIVRGRFLRPRLRASGVVFGDAAFARSPRPMADSKAGRAPPVPLLFR